MKKALVLLLIMIISLVKSQAQNDMLLMEGQIMHSRILNSDIHYSVSLPTNYYKDNNTKFPVTYLLHGFGDDASAWVEYGAVNRFMEKAILDGDAIPMILIMPEAFNSYYVNDYAGKFMYQDMFIKELVPYIDSVFRTIRNKDSRALIGYSMGGFGAMILHLQHPDIFGTAVPLSMSVRTDEQYMTEEASGWDDQWGRLFGAQGALGKARITDYYRKNSPFHILAALTENEKAKLNIYMLNGDDEQTLCRSNEELHILMHKIGLRHEYRVVNGGHSFKVWKSALTDAFRFISDSFQQKIYRGDKSVLLQEPQCNRYGKPLTVIAETITYNEIQLGIYLPDDYKSSDRKYPVLFVENNLDKLKDDQIAGFINSCEAISLECPVIIVSVPTGNLYRLPQVYDFLKDRYRVREGYKFRSIMAIGSDGYEALKCITGAMRFNTLIMINNSITRKQVEQVITDENLENLKKTRIFIENIDNSAFAEGIGILHILLRENDISHEYRVREENKEEGPLKQYIKESIEYAAGNFHR